MKVDILIRNGLVVDGTGSEGRISDVAVDAGRILAVGPDLDLEVGRVLDARGLVVSPGFVDNHTHGDQFFLFGTDAYNLLEQGVTTEIAWNCGGSAAPFYEGLLDGVKGLAPDELIDQVRDRTRDFRTFTEAASGMHLGTNMAFYAGHGNIRARVMGYSDARPTPAQMAEMKAWVEQAMDCGFLGLSSGLIYPPSVYGDQEELSELCRVVASHGGCYSSHVRGECDTVVAAVAEAIAIGENAGCDVVVSHHKIGGRNNAGSSSTTLRLVREANERGRIRVLADHYPFLAGHTSLLATLDPVFSNQGVRVLLERLKDGEFRRTVADRMFHPESQSLLRFSGFEGCLVLGAPRTRECVGKTLAEIAAERGTPPADTLFDLLVENDGDADAAFFYINEPDMLAILADPHVVAGSDCGHAIAHFDPETAGGEHPRAISTFPKRLGMIRDRSLLSLEESIRRITSMPAEFVHLEDTGVLREGARADLCIFDGATIAETNDYLHPYRRNIGIGYVLVNGGIAVEKGVHTGVRAGRMLKRRA